MVFAEGGSVNGEETPANAQLFQIVFKMLCYYQLINRQKIKLLFSVILFYTHLFERKKWKSVIVITMIVLIVVFRFDVT